MASNRVFYACQSVSLGGNTLHGVQSVGINSTFNFEQVFELGQIEIYENIEGVPEVEMTIERVLDGNATLYQSMATQTDNSPGQSLVDVGDARTTGILSIFDDTEDSSGSPSVGVQATGLFVSNYSVNINLDGPSTESMTLVGNHRAWATHGAGAVYTGTPEEVATAVIKRQSLDRDVSVLPQGADKLQSISVSVDFGREDLQELGEKYPYFKAATYPTEVTCEFTYLADDTFTNTEPQGTTHAFYEKDIVGDGGSDTNKNKDVTEDEEIMIRLKSIDPATGNAVAGDGYTINLGDKCRLTGIQFGGGDAGGGNATVTYSYSTYNELYSKVGSHTASNP